MISSKRPFVVLLVFAFPVSPAQGQPPTKTEAPKQWAVLIAVQEHRNPRFNLQFTQNDVVRLRQTLQDRAGMPAAQILEISDRAAVKPTLANLRRALPEFLKQAKPGDRVIVFFSGHGVLHKDQTYLIPLDYDAKQVEATSLPAGEVRKILTDCAAKTKFLILDCCHAGGDRGGEAESLPADAVARAVEPEKINGCVVLASCSAKEKSFEWAERKQGVFSYWLCRALEGGFGSDAGGQLEFGAVYNYVHERVTRTAQHVFARPQTPVRIIGGGVAGRLDILTLRPEPPESLCRRMAEHFDLEIREHKLKQIGVLEFLQPLGKIEGLGPANLPAYFAEQVREHLKKLGGASYDVLSMDKTKEATKGVKVEGLGQLQSLQIMGKRGVQGLIYGTLKPQGTLVTVKADLVETKTGNPLFEFAGRLPLSEDLVGDLGGSFDNVNRPQGGPYAAPVVNHVLGQLNEGHPLLKDNFPFKIEIHSVLAKNEANITDATPRKKKELVQLAIEVDPAAGKKRIDLLVGAKQDEIFELYLWNHYGDSVAATVLVDGINTLGQKRERLGQARSWVIEPTKGGRFTFIDGWHIPKTASAQAGNKNQFTVRRFKFVDVAQSVAARHGFDESLGLITVAFYARKGRSLAVGEGPEEERPIEAADFVSGRLIALVNIRYVDEKELQLKSN